MSNERSPRFPAENIEECLNRLEKLYTEAKRSPVDSSTAAIAIGYGGLNGASKTMLAALSAYGLIQREGHTHKVSDDGFRIIRPIGDEDKRSALRSAVFKPKTFSDIREKHADASEAVLARVLLHQGFTEEGAGRAARVYKENVAFLEAQGENGQSKEAERGEGELPLFQEHKQPAAAPVQPINKPIVPTGNMLAQYLIPLGPNQAQLIFTGEKLTPADFDDLKDYVDLFKKQFERALRSAPKTDQAEPSASLIAPEFDEPGAG